MGYRAGRRARLTTAKSIVKIIIAFPAPSSSRKYISRNDQNRGPGWYVGDLSTMVQTLVAMHQDLKTAQNCLLGKPWGLRKVNISRQLWKFWQFYGREGLKDIETKPNPHESSGPDFNPPSPLFCIRLITSSKTSYMKILSHLNCIWCLERLFWAGFIILLPLLVHCVEILAKAEQEYITQQAQVKHWTRLLQQFSIL